MSRKTRFIIAGVVIVVGGAAAVAAVGPRGHWRGQHGMGPMMFSEFGGGQRGGRGIAMLKQLDADKDGSVTLAEFTSPAKARFDRLDANKDGAIDAKEAKTTILETANYSARRFMHRLDKDKDRRVSLEEFRSAPRGRFAARDVNADGQITEDDLPPWRRGGAEQGDGADAQKGGKGERRWTLDRILGRFDRAFKRFDTNSDGFIDVKESEAAVAERVAYAVTRFMARFDADKDGRVSLAEFERFSKSRFADLDLNDDGKITEEDLPPRMRGKGILR